jgi:hypothetical protein
VQDGVAGNVDCPKGSALLPSSLPGWGGEGNMAAGGLIGREPSLWVRRLL